MQYLLNNGWTPCIEFESAEKAYCDSHGWTGIDYNVNAGYYDNRYWVMWKLPMYGCTNPEEVLQEVRACTRSFPECFIRVAGFDNIKQVQCSSFLAHRPTNDRTFAHLAWGYGQLGDVAGVTATAGLMAEAGVSLRPNSEARKSLVRACRECGLPASHADRSRPRTRTCARRA